MLMQSFPFTETILSGLCAFLLGLFWYHPKVMGTRWIEARGKILTDVKRSALPYLVSFVLWMLAACFYSFLLIIMGLGTVSSLIGLSCLLWVAFAMPPTIMGALYTGYPFNAVAIDSAYQLAGYYMFALVHIVIRAVMAT
jgi:hypothetical protein